MRLGRGTGSLRSSGVVWISGTKGSVVGLGKLRVWRLGGVGFRCGKVGLG